MKILYSTFLVLVLGFGFLFDNAVAERRYIPNSARIVFHNTLKTPVTKSVAIKRTIKPIKTYKSYNITQFRASVVTPKPIIAQKETDQLFDLINDARTSRGLAKLAFRSDLATISQHYAQNMAQNRFFSHKNQQGKYVEDRLADSGISFVYYGENLARGQQNAAEVMRDWENSKSHWDNLLAPQFTHMGLGYVKSRSDDKGFSTGGYWVLTMTK